MKLIRAGSQCRLRKTPPMKASTMKSSLALAALLLTVGACASSTVQQMSRTTFQISSTTAPICGGAAAPKIASKVAAIEVIRRGGDLFVLTGADTSDQARGNFSAKRQGVIVMMVDETHPAFDDALSARELLGADWQKQVRSGKPGTCL